ncbi:hypothetical protein IFM89_039176 [Coptis chinensis]|uniref:WRKY domain-containing protein n=1 Tax=Coptis chinensis TaxID=261450 RepID=A0A835H334_9MAGN|nr:hypothetical protein IFM89_039176 [Coptis chinensis]
MDGGKAFAESKNLHYESSMPVEGQCDSQTFEYSSSVENETKEATSRELTLSVYEPNVVAVDNVNLRSDELIEVPVAVAELHQGHSLDTGVQDVQSNLKGIGPSRSWEDGYNWRKYGQKHIKGNEFPRSYYKCSHPKCLVKKQVEQSQDGQITDVIYKGKHDHPKPQSMSQLAAGTVSPVQGEKLNEISCLKSTEDKSSNGSSQTINHLMPNTVPELPKPNVSPELGFVVPSDNNVNEGAQLTGIRDEIEGDNDPESKRQCLEFNTEMTSSIGANHGQHKESVQAHQNQAQAIVSSSSNVDVIAAYGSREMTVYETAHDLASDMVSSKALGPLEVDMDDSQKRQEADICVQSMQTDHRGTNPSVTPDRFWGDGYNWRKYGQKHIKGSEFPRSYYRCTHPNCQMKKQLECSHDGQITEIIYKGEHNHPKPQPSSHISVGRILSVQEEGFERFDKSLNGHGQTTHLNELNHTPELNLVQASDSNVQLEGSKSNRTDDNVEHESDLDSKYKHLAVTKDSSNGISAGFNHQDCKPFVEVQGQSKAWVSSTSVKNKNIAAPSRELAPSLTVSNSPVYMVTSRGIVPVGVDKEDKRQRQNTGNGIDIEESTPSGLSLSMTERLLENAYHWRKYGQKNIKGSEFPRSYYRCTHPNCQVKMHLERSHDGRVIEIIYKGKHDHPKPQPITRMAIEKSLPGDVQTSVNVNRTRIPKLSPIRQCVEKVETEDEKFIRSCNGVEEDDDTESKRKKDIGEMVLTPVVRTPREPRVVVETLSEVDVVDDGYRWQKYGRKMVKGNPNPRNYYRCSNGGCSVKKHVERAANKPEAVVTTYEGKHNHDLPPPRTAGNDTAGLLSYSNCSNGALGRRPGELVSNGVDAEIMDRSSPEYGMYGGQEIMDVDPIQIQYDITGADVIDPATVSAHNGDLKEDADQDNAENMEC